MIHRVRRAVPAPGALPVLGHALWLFRDPLGFLTTAGKSGDLVQVRLGLTTAYLVCTPELVQQVLLDPRTFDKGGALYDAFRYTFGWGTGSCPYHEHREKRHRIQPIFHRNQVPAYAKMVGEEVGAMTARWGFRQTFDVNAVMRRLAVSVAMRLLFPHGATDDAVTVVEEDLPVLMTGMYRRAIVPNQAVHRIPVGPNRRYDRAMNRLHGLIDELAEREQRKGGGVAPLLASDGGGLSGRELHDELVGLLVGATETTAATLSWVFVLLGENPDVEAQVRKEAVEVLGDRVAGFDDLSGLACTQRVVTEALRLYPPVWVLMRTTAEDTELAGQRIPRDSTVLFSPYMLHRDDRLFERPGEFAPDRWLPGNPATSLQTAWIPFGAGNRKCVGDVFATVEATIVVASIAARWRLRPAFAKRPSVRPRGDLGTGEVRMTVHAA